MEEAGAGSAWAIKPGTAWAEEVEAEEAKHGPLVSEHAFPSLGEAAKQPQAKTGKKAKGTKLSLSDFAASPFVASRRAQPSDKEILMALPKGSSGLPKEERDSKALGGGFKDYGGNRQQGGFGDRGGRGDREEREPSRADSTADWGAERKFVPSDRPGGGGGGFGGGSFSRDRDGGFGGRSGGSGGFGDRPPREERPISEADTVDDWGANRKFTPSAGDSDRRGGGGAGGGGGGGFGGGGFRDRERPAGGGPPRFSDEPSRADTGDWGARRSTPDSDRPGPGGAGAGGGAGGGRDRRGYGFSDQPMSQADLEDKWSHRGPPPAEGGDKASAAPAERPRLKLAPRTLPLPEQPGQQQQEQQQANGAVASPRGSEAGSSGSGQQQEKKAPKSNPFGAARPREEVLKEKGIDYQKEELKLEHGEVLRDPTPEETEMEGEVEALRKQLEELQTTSPDETDTISDVKKELDEKERALYTLQAKLDDEVRYSKHKPERDGPTRGASSSSAAPPEDLSGFEPVRSTRRERPAAAAGGDAAAAAGSSGQQQQQQEGGAAPAAAGGAGGSGGGGAWGRGGGRSGGGGFGSFSNRDRDGRDGGGRGGGRDGGGRDGGGAPPPRERRQNESLAGRAGGGW